MHHRRKQACRSLSTSQRCRLLRELCSSRLRRWPAAMQSRPTPTYRQATAVESVQFAVLPPRPVATLFRPIANDHQVKADGPLVVAEVQHVLHLLKAAHLSVQLMQVSMQSCSTPTRCRHCASNHCRLYACRDSATPIAMRCKVLLATTQQLVDTYLRYDTAKNCNSRAGCRVMLRPLTKSTGDSHDMFSVFYGQP